VAKEILEKFIIKLSKERLQSIKEFERAKRRLCREEGCSFPKNNELRQVYQDLAKNGKIKTNESLADLLMARRVRTLSGVAVVAVLTKPYECPGRCLYCPTEKGMPKSYLSNEPAVMRAIMTKFHPYTQVQARLAALQINGHKTDKIELIVMGGTFSHFSKKYQKWFIKECFRAANDFRGRIKSEDSFEDEKSLKSKELEEELEKEKKKNEKTRNRIVGLTLETRPDFIKREEIINFRKLGATRVELGVQSVFDDVLEKNKRGHDVAETVKATKLLKDAGFKINYHLMPGLLGSNPKRDLEMFQEVYNNPNFQPDMVKIYPCVVNENAELHKLWKAKKYKALSNEQNKKLMIAIKKLTPPYVRINRLIRDIPEESIIAGPNVSNLRQIMQNEQVKCDCIRCREVKGEYSSKEKIILNKISYKASEGKEIFLQMVSEDKKKLFALLRLRLPEKNKKHFLKVLDGSAIIREVHTFGKLESISGKKSQSPQHIGLGKKFLREAEKIAKKQGYQKMAVISGVGVRDYYRKNAYRLQDEYMVKKL
jgi:elongator complex protein 3